MHTPLCLREVSWSAFLGYRQSSCLTNVEIGDELRHCFPSEVHRTNALAKKGEPGPSRILDHAPRLEENEMKSRRFQYDIKSCLENCYKFDIRKDGKGCAHLDFVDDLLLRGVYISAVNNTDNIRSVTLQRGNGCPEDPFSATPGITCTC